MPKERDASEDADGAEPEYAGTANPRKTFGERFTATTAGLARAAKHSVKVGILFVSKFASFVGSSAEPMKHLAIGGVLLFVVTYIYLYPTEFNNHLKKAGFQVNEFGQIERYANDRRADAGQIDNAIFEAREFGNELDQIIKNNDNDPKFVNLKIRFEQVTGVLTQTREDVLATAFAAQEAAEAYRAPSRNIRGWIYLGDVGDDKDRWVGAKQYITDSQPPTADQITGQEPLKVEILNPVVLRDNDPARVNENGTVILKRSEATALRIMKNGDTVAIRRLDYRGLKNSSASALWAQINFVPPDLDVEKTRTAQR